MTAVRNRIIAVFVALMLAIGGVPAVSSTAFAADSSSSAATAANHHTKGESYDDYPVYYGSTDEYGYHIITEAALGCRLADGVAYRVTSNVTLKPDANDYMTALVARNNLIYIDANCTLTVYGSDGLGQKPGLPGIALAETYSLCLMGDGKVVARGGVAGNGENGHDAQQPYKESNRLYGGDGGAGGNGGGGAGAGIGTAGAWGAAGGLGGTTSSVEMKRFATDQNGNDGQVARAPETAKESGQLSIGANVAVDAQGGHHGRCGTGGDAGWWQVEREFITLWVAGGSGGGGGGGGGGAANAFGMGGTGGWGGGGGGSSGSCWLTLGRDEVPATGSGGAAGLFPVYNRDYCRNSDSNGKGIVRTRGNQNCTGGKGAPTPDVNLYEFPSLLTVGNLYVLNYDSTRVSMTQWDKNPALATPVTDYTGFASMSAKDSWYLQNKLNDVDGVGGVSEFATVAGCTTVDQVKTMLTSNLPSVAGYTFKGWALEGDTSKMVYDATTGTFNTSLLLSEKKIDERGIWMCPTLTTLKAVWEKPGYTIVYHANGGKFINADGTTSQATTYTQTGCKFKSAVKLCTSTDLGSYKALLPPDGIPEKPGLLKWCTEVNDQGEPTGSMYELGEETAELNPEDKEEVHLYAVWKEPNSSSINKAHHTYGTSYDSYPVFEGTMDAEGYRILTSDAAGCRLVPGAKYRVVSNLTLYPDQGDYYAGLVTCNNTIYVNSGCKLTVYGSDGQGQNPGLPGIALSEGQTLCLTGDGTVRAYGGDAGDGSNGQDADNSTGDRGGIYSGKGGDGGAGGGGAGAGIGTAGSRGGNGGIGGAFARPASASGMIKRSNDGKDGGAGTAAEKPAASGALTITGNVNVQAAGGKAATTVAKGGKKGMSRLTSYFLSKLAAGESGGGGAGGGGGAANAFGMGGIGGSGGGGGGSAGVISEYLFVRMVGNSLPSGAGGIGGAAAPGSTANGESGDGLRGQAVKSPNRIVSKGGEAGASEAPKYSVDTNTSSLLTVTKKDGRMVDLPAWDGTQLPYTQA